MLQSLDQNNDGEVSRDEFLGYMACQDQAVRHKNIPIRQLAENMFRMFDDDGSGSITVEEFSVAMQKSGAGLNDNEIASLVHELDKDGDGDISLEEFAELLERHAGDC